MNPIYIIGGGRFSIEMCEAFYSANPGLELAGLFDDNLNAKPFRPAFKHLGPISAFVELTPPDARYILAIGHNEIREKISAALEGGSRRPFSLVHPTAVVSPAAALADGAYIAAFAFIGPNSKIGRNALINVGASIGHDAILGDVVQICPGARVSGCAAIGNGSFIGSNAIVAPGVVLGHHVRLAAGSFAPRNMPDESSGIGIPAKIL